MENKYLQVRKESIFTRFVNFIKRTFGKKADQEVFNSVDKTQNENVKTNFFDEIKINKEENREILDLQSKYENKEIDLSVMSNEEIHELNSLYKRQVSDLKKKLEDKKTQLAIMNNRIKSYSSNI